MLPMCDTIIIIETMIWICDFAYGWQIISIFSFILISPCESVELVRLRSSLFDWLRSGRVLLTYEIGSDNDNPMMLCRDLRNRLTNESRFGSQNWQQSKQCTEFMHLAKTWSSSNRDDETMANHIWSIVFGALFSLQCFPITIALANQLVLEKKKEI